jgi:hypothetical protein
VSLHAASPRMNLDVTADESCLDPHVSCVKTSHPAAPLDVNSEQRSVRQSMMSGPHRADSAHTLTTFGTSGKFIRASRSGMAKCHQTPPFSVIVPTTASRPRRPRADAVRVVSSNVVNTHAAGGWLEAAFRLSKIRAIATAAATRPGRTPEPSAWSGALGL